MNGAGQFQNLVHFFYRLIVAPVLASILSRVLFSLHLVPVSRMRYAGYVALTLKQFARCAGTPRVKVATAPIMANCGTALTCWPLLAERG
jgi:hypothetical protein